MVQIKAERYETLTDWLRAQARGITQPVARVLHQWGVHPNLVTLLGFLGCVGAASVVAMGHARVGGVLLGFAASLDAFDGALARLAGVDGRFGAFFDSTLDRLSDSAVILGILWWQLPTADPTMVLLLFLLLLGAVMVSYTRARAEGAGYSCKVGLLTRVPRVAVLVWGLILGLIRPMVILMVVLSWFTVLQRILYVYKAAQHET
mgnify:CR=1 FL=1